MSRHTFPLADTSDGNTPLEVDILIVSNYYWQQLTGEVRCGENGPIILTRFGWVPSGPMAATGQEVPIVTLVATHTLGVDADYSTLKNIDAYDCLHSFWNLAYELKKILCWRNSTTIMVC